MSMLKRLLVYIGLAGLAAVVLYLPRIPGAEVETEGGRTYIVDRHGERWDVTQAETLGFAPEKFQYGIGRHAFTPLDDSYLSRDTAGTRSDLRIIGVAEEGEAKAFSVPKLAHHEVANTGLAGDAVAVAY
jgi:hypothetical protein